MCLGRGSADHCRLGLLGTVADRDGWCRCVACWRRVDVDMYSVDLTAGPAGSDHLRGPVQHRQGSEDPQAAPSSSGCIPLRWYQGKNLQTRIATMSDLT